MKMKLNKGDGPSFIKILSGDSVDYLPLPIPFAKEHLAKRNINKQSVFLKTEPNGDKWRVKYSKLEDRYYFMDGWLKFMNHNRLRKNDILVFRLLSCSKKTIFKVCFYSPNGCRKQPTTSDDGNKPLVVKVKQETSDDSLVKNAHNSFRQVFRKSYEYKMPMLKSFIEATGIGGYDTVRLKNDEGKILEVKVTTGSYNPLMTSGWSEFKKLINVQLGKTCEFTHVESNLIHVRVLKMRGGPTRID